MLNDSLSTLLGQFERGAFSKLLHAKVSPSGRAELTESLVEEVRTSCWPRDGGRAGLLHSWRGLPPGHSVRLSGGHAHRHQVTTWSTGQQNHLLGWPRDMASGRD